MITICNYCIKTRKCVKLSPAGPSAKSSLNYLRVRWNTCYLSIGNRFHVKLRILSPYLNRIWFYLNRIWFYLNKNWGCVILREIDFLLKICWSIPCLHPSWKVHTWIEICASLNNRKKTKADGSRLIPRKRTETLVLLSNTNRSPLLQLKNVFGPKWTETFLSFQARVVMFYSDIWL